MVNTVGFTEVVTVCRGPPVSTGLSLGDEVRQGCSSYNE